MTTAVPAHGTVGAFPGISIEDYHADHSAVSKSALDDFRRSPYLYWANRFDPSKPADADKETAAHLTGNLLHCATLEPNEFEKRYMMIPETAPRRPSITQRNAKKPSDETIAAIAWWDKFLLDNAGKQEVTPEAWAKAWAMAASLQKISAVRELMSSGKAEVSEYSVDPVTGLWVKTRPDWQKAFGGDDLLADVKSVGDARPDEFVRRQVPAMRYHVQDAFYSDNHRRATGRDTLGFLFLICETEWPYLANVVELGPMTKEEGRRVARADLGGIKRHMDAGSWDSEGQHVQQVEMPAWAFEEKPE